MEESPLKNVTKWVFRGRTHKDSIFNEGGKYIELVNPTQIVSTMSSKLYRIPKDLELIHAYHPDYEKLIEFNNKLSIESLKLNKTKLKLFISQKGKCTMCSQSLLNEQGEFLYDGSTHIHHNLARSQGGSKSKLSNLSLVHRSCHIEHHK